MIRLGVNIDHVATLRQARYRDAPDEGEPDPVRAAHEAELGGADIITVHLREDRRHIIDADLERLRALVRVRLNLEMAATEEMVGIATRVVPGMVTLVPEGRQEVTTEGGLDVRGLRRRLEQVVASLHRAGIVVSAFVDAEPDQIEAARDVGFDACELHTGPYARAFARCGGDGRRPELAGELDRIAAAGRAVCQAGLRLNAGHGLGYANVRPIADLPGLEELHIGHAIISRAVYVGLRRAVREMKSLLRPQPGAGSIT